MASLGNDSDRKKIIVNSNFLKKKGLCGLRNLGNTCFMNTIIQCLSNSIPFLKYTLEGNYLEDINEDKITSDLSYQWRIMLINLWHKNAVYTPNTFLSTVQDLARKKDYPEFTGLKQSDSQEFLQFFLESLHDSVSREVNMSITGEPLNEFDKLAIEAYKSFKEFFKNDYSEIIKIFYGQFLSTNKRKNKEKITVSRNYDPFNILSLEITTENGKNLNSLQECLDNFTKLEVVSDELTRQIKFWSLPNILIIMFKRFKDHDIHQNRNSKIENLVSYPLDNLDLSKYVIGYNSDSYVYDLFGIANHGGNSNWGHYWAYIRNSDNNWYKYNDHTVSTCQLEDIVSSEAYCLFYAKKGI